MLARPHIVCVDMGHTHHNELANDGRTIFMASRSTGQIEEGPAGVAFAAVDGGVVTWRCKPLDDTWPRVMITSPANHRLITDPASPDRIIRGPSRIAAKVWAMPAATRVHASIGAGPEFPPGWDGRSAWLWCAASRHSLANGKHELTVRAESKIGQAAFDTTTFAGSHSGGFEQPPRAGDGSDKDTVGAWPEKHLLGTRLGPNRNGRQW